MFLTILLMLSITIVFMSLIMNTYEIYLHILFIKPILLMN